MGYKTERLAHALPAEIKLTPASRLVLWFLCFRVNDSEAIETGVYSAIASEGAIRRATGLSRGTLYRSLDALEGRCGFYLITRRSRRDTRSVLYLVHVTPDDLAPEAIARRRQDYSARQSAGARRNTSQNETYFLFPEVLKSDVNTSQNETYSPENTSQNETHLQRRVFKRNPKGELTEVDLGRLFTQALAHYRRWHGDYGWDPTAPDLPETVESAVDAIGGWERLAALREYPRDLPFARRDFMDAIRSLSALTDRE